MHLCKPDVLVWALNMYVFLSKGEIGESTLLGGNNENNSAFLLTSISVA